MNAGFGRRPTLVWLALSAITLAQLGVRAVGGDGGAAPNTAIAAGAVGIALLKVRIILREFMEVRHAPALLGRLTDLWIASTATVLLVGHLAGSANAGG